MPQWGTDIFLIIRIQFRFSRSNSANCFAATRRASPSLAMTCRKCTEQLPAWHDIGIGHVHRGCRRGPASTPALHASSTRPATRNKFVKGETQAFAVLFRVALVQASRKGYIFSSSLACIIVSHGPMQPKAIFAETGRQILAVLFRTALIKTGYIFGGSLTCMIIKSLDDVAI